MAAAAGPSVSKKKFKAQQEATKAEQVATRAFELGAEAYQPEEDAEAIEYRDRLLANQAQAAEEERARLAADVEPEDDPAEDEEDEDHQSSAQPHQKENAGADIGNDADDYERVDASASSGSAEERKARDEEMIFQERQLAEARASADEMRAALKRKDAMIADLVKEAQTAADNSRQQAASVRASSRPREREQPREEATHRPQLNITMPSQVTADSLAVKGALDSYLYTLRGWFGLMLITADAQKLAYLSNFHDVYLDAWWKSQLTAAIETGDAITTWEQYEAIVRSRFVSKSLQAEAADRIATLRMGDHEKMEDYIRRAEDIRTTAGNLIDREARLQTRILLNGIAQRRYPLAWKWLQIAYEKGELVSWAAMCKAMGEHGRLEPEHWGPPQQPAQRQPQQQGQIRASAAAIRAEAEERIRVQALETDSDACRKCGSSGHGSWECKNRKELRKCYNCNEVGHLAATCSKPRKDRPVAKTFPATKPSSGNA